MVLSSWLGFHIVTLHVCLCNILNVLLQITALFLTVLRSGVWATLLLINSIALDLCYCPFWIWDHPQTLNILIHPGVHWTFNDFKPSRPWGINYTSYKHKSLCIYWNPLSHLLTGHCSAPYTHPGGLKEIRDRRKSM